ncbi:YfaP family protein [Pseudomonas akapageensis]|uniref:YfaP family protein n=1 Tax=Pseudomonas akapageensis TaxID=2609961 RepID=UPI00140D9E73|nr:hypothetical protein [Pseudomonas akapageensis]
MKNFKKAMFAFSSATLLLAQPATAALDLDTFCAVKDTAIYFGNGIDTTEISAKVNLVGMQLDLRSKMDEDEYKKIEFGLSYNSTSTVIGDLLESAIQSLGRDIGDFWRMLAHYVPMPNVLRDGYLQGAALLDEIALVDVQDRNRHVSAYKDKLLQGKKVIVVAHSQGNFFVNQEYTALTSEEQRGFGIVSAANPDTRVVNGGPYTTIAEDKVIEAIRLFKVRSGLPAPLIVNVPTTGFELPDNILGHSFQLAYLWDNTASKEKLLRDIMNTRRDMVQPTPLVIPGIITATLTWGSQPDVDLHAFEPNRSHVFYAARTGLSGTLDRDVTTGFGAEHYVVPCEKLEAGTYNIGVNYFSGSGPEIATVLVQAGLSAFPYTLFLPNAVGAVGNDSPKHVASVKVTGNKEEGFKLEIIP